MARASANRFYQNRVIFTRSTRRPRDCRLDNFLFVSVERVTWSAAVNNFNKVWLSCDLITACTSVIRGKRNCAR